MHWMIFAAVIVAGLVSSFTDWFFMGVLFHDRYAKYPDTWWPRSGAAAERGPIIWSTALGFVTAAAVAALTSIGGGLAVGALAAIAGPLVISPTAGMWVRIDPLVTAAHTAGYIVRFLIAGLAAGFALS